MERGYDKGPGDAAGVPGGHGIPGVQKPSLIGRGGRMRDLLVILPGPSVSSAIYDVIVVVNSKSCPG